MKNSLKTLQRIQKFSIDEQRKILNDYLEAEEKLHHRLQKLNQEFENEKEFARTHAAGDFGAYVKRYMKNRDALEAQLRALRLKIEEVREIIADMFKEQKTYEIVDRNRAARQQKEEDDKTQKTLDEIGTNAYIKRKKQTQE